jgi:hypothetical protein
MMFELIRIGGSVLVEGDVTEQAEVISGEG